MLEELACFLSSKHERQAGYDAYIHFYNHNRSHGGLGWATPAATLATDNLPAEHI